MNRVTLKQIAKVTGYSVMAVSNAFTGRGRIGAEAEVEIRRVAEAMGYVPNMGARAIRTGRSGLIALVLDGGVPRDLRDWVEAIQGAEGCAAVVFVTGGRFSLGKVAALRPEGVVWFGGGLPRDRGGLHIVAGTGEPGEVLEGLLPEVEER